MSKTILYAKNIAELIKILNNNPGTKVVGGCTRIENLPDKFISTRGIKELSHISRHERYIDVGPGVTLSDLIAIGQTHQLHRKSYNQKYSNNRRKHLF